MSSPYAPPQAEVGDHAPAGAMVTDGAIEALLGTKGWVLLIGILLFLGAAFCLIGAAGMVFGGAMMGAGVKNAPPPGMMMGAGALYVVLAAVYVFLGIYLVKYSSAIGRLVNGGQAEDLEGALQQQRKFWRLTGVLALITVVLMVTGIVAAIAIPMMSAGVLK